MKHRLIRTTTLVLALLGIGPIVLDSAGGCRVCCSAGDTGAAGGANGIQ